MAKKITALVFLLLFSSLAAGGRTKLNWVQEFDDNEDGICKLMVETQGYTCEEHKVTTKDGYILSMQRIPTGRAGGGERNEAKTPVVLQHGIMSDASTWLSNSPHESLGFILADNGYDVWLANVRGTNYSRGHISLSPDDAVWTYTKRSNGRDFAYDLPASLQYVYDQTGQKLHYVGHSLGTLMAFGAFSRQEVLNIVRSAALLSPIAYLGQMPSPLARAAADAFIAETLYWLGLNEFAPGGGPFSKLVDDICNKQVINCSDIMSIFTVIRHGTIEMYDYGSEDANNEHYGQSTPPGYNMTSIPDDLPLFLAYGGKDLISDVNDVQTLINTLVDHDPDKLVELYREDYAHLDFVNGVNANQVVYNPLMAFFKLN
ncbi:hypothetical protein RD792_000149 [Penstemon davidsonii]|uniref:Lipase n=1 Tax=Penstemon davidsonii TaxID=160366 RepID=A0ABR0DUT0_9LAMI|nr:hypothetical protein RD792_000149 [Penstemon davidsonii]